MNIEKIIVKNVIASFWKLKISVGIKIFENLVNIFNFVYTFYAIHYLIGLK